MRDATPVILESPYGNVDPAVVAENVAYAYRCMRDSLLRGEAPFASHLLYTQMLDDRVPVEREIGIEAGFAWRQFAKLTVVYVDRGISTGMKFGIEDSRRRGVRIVYRELRPIMNTNGGYASVDVEEPEGL